MSETNKTKVSESDTAKKAAAKTAVKKDVKSKAEPGPVVYLGPDIKGIVNHCDVFRGGCGSLFDEKVKEFPLLKKMCVPVKEAGRKMAELKNGGAFVKLYEAVKEQLKEGEKDE